LFEKIEREPESNCIYKRIKLGYNYGLGKIYANEEIEKAKQSPSFEREFNLKFLGKVGNVFSPLQIEECLELGELYSVEKIPVSQYNIISVGCDPGFGSSKTAICFTEFLKKSRIIRNRCSRIR
jgi:hypothetical protein